MKTAGEKFCEFIERGLSFERSCGSRGRKALCDKEAIAWELRDSGGPAGSILPGDDLIRNRVSFLRKDLDVVPFARRMLEEGFAALAAKNDEDSWKSQSNTGGPRSLAAPSASPREWNAAPNHQDKQP